MSEEVGECLPEEVAICVNTKHMEGSSMAAGSLRAWVQGSLEEWTDGAVAQEEEVGCSQMELAP